MDAVSGVIARTAVATIVMVVVILTSLVQPAEGAARHLWSGALGPSGGITQLSCAGTLCVGIAASEYEVVVSQNRGVSWDWKRLPGKVPNAVAVSCSSSENCVLAGALRFPRRGALWVTADGGRRWNVRRLPKTVLELNDVACPLPNRCLADGFLGPEGESRGSVLLSSSQPDGRWSATGQYADDRGAGEVSCTRTGTCVAAYADTPVIFSNDWGPITVAFLGRHATQLSNQANWIEK